MSKVLVWREGEGEGRVRAYMSKVLVWRYKVLVRSKVLVWRGEGEGRVRA